MDELLPYKLTSHNTFRVVFDRTGSFEFELAGSIDDISIMVRNYGDTVRIKLDGKKLPAMKTSCLLPEGLKELYLESEKLSLEAGKHHLSLITESRDYPYFPSVFIAGNFSVKEDNLLGKLPDRVSIGDFRDQGLKEYTGSITFSKKIHTGKYECCSIDTQGLLTEFFINGQSLGRRAWAPFIWEIPPKFRNKKVNMEIRIWTSAGPLFGSYPRDAGKEGSVLQRFAPK
jgi:hypothetical protein